MFESNFAWQAVGICVCMRVGEWVSEWVNAEVLAGREGEGTHRQTASAVVIILTGSVACLSFQENKQSQIVELSILIYSGRVWR